MQSGFLRIIQIREGKTSKQQFENVDFGVHWSTVVFFLFYPLKDIFSIREVIYPHVPVGIPCYDLTPITDSRFVPHCDASTRLSFHSLTGSECKEQGHIHGNLLICHY